MFYKTKVEPFKDKLWLSSPTMHGEEIKYMQEAYETNWMSTVGKNIDMIEKLACEKVRRKYAVALSSGTAALHMAVRLAGSKVYGAPAVGHGAVEGKKVFCSDMTFDATVNPVVYEGGVPVFIDTERDTWNMDPELLEIAIKDRIEKTGKKPKAIVPVYLYGMPAKIDEIIAIAEKYDIPVIEDAAEGFGSKYKGQRCGTFGKYGVLSFNGNKMITTSGGGALITPSANDKKEIMFYATQAREAYPYYQHENIGYNYRMSNICAGIGRGQMTVADEHISHHKHIQKMYEELLADIKGVTIHSQPSTGEYDSNYWLCTITLDPALRVRGQENAYQVVVQGAVGGAAGVTHEARELHTDCEPNANVEAMRIFLDTKGIESRPLWKPMHKQPVYADADAYVNGVSENLFKVGMCLPSGPCVTDDEVRYIVECIKEAILVG